MVESSTVRESRPEYAAHVLGYLGSMDPDEWPEYQKQGYSMDAQVGKAGLELAFEEYLHGIDGTRVDIVSKDGAIIDQYWANAYDEEGNIIGVKAPVAGNNVEITLDNNIQQVAEDALADVMAWAIDPSQNTEVGEHTGLDAQGAAVIVMEPKTGNILACASYPTYNLATMTEDWEEINNNTLNPLFNRAFGAAYPPGSTYKMCTLIAAMENKNKQGEFIYKAGDVIEDKGVYEMDGGFRAACLFWTSSKATHGKIDAVKALCYSCNYFFYELGYRVLEEQMDETAKALGLGEPTGIELNEEIGHRNNSARKAEVYTGINAIFSAGDRVLGAIGQGENRFTPLQLCVYASTLANKGTRMKATFLSRVVSSDYRTLILQNEPKVISQMELSWQTVEAYMQGMREVITYPGGTATKYFGGWSDQLPDVWAMKNEVTVYAKTGTSQHASGGSDHGAFVCFSHRADETEPDLAVAIFGEKIAHGSSLGPVAEKILLAYYELDAASEVTAFENQAG